MSSPKPRWTTRMGSVMRRTSSILTVSRPNTPSIASDKEADNASLLNGNIKAQPSVAAQVITPSPILESPLGERAAEENAGLSLFAQPSTSSEPVPPIPVTSSPPVDDLQSPIGYIPPPVLDSTVGNPGAFTDEPDELPQPEIAKDPHALASVEPQVGVVPEGTPQHEPEPEALIVEAMVEEPASYLDEPVAEVKDLQAADHVDDTIAFGGVHETISLPEPDFGKGEAAEYYRGDVIPTTSEAVHQNANVALPEPEAGTHHHDGVIPVTTERQEGSQQKSQPIVIPTPVPLPNYELSSYPMNFSSGEEVWGEEHGYGREGLHHSYPSSVPVIIPNPEDLKQVENGPAPNMRMPEADPFADPIAPRITVSHPDLKMPEPETAEEHHGRGSSEIHRDIHGPIVMPLPSYHGVSHSKPVHHIPSNSSLRDRDIGRFGMPVPAETDETLPLLSRPGTPSKHKLTSHFQSSAHSHSRKILSVSPLVFTSSQSTASNGNANSWNPHPGSHPRLHTLGWLEYYLSDGAVYYVHPTTRVTTEINLRSERMLNGVERFLEDHGKDHPGSAMEGTAAAGGEVWLRDVGTAKSGMILQRWWVDHKVRTVVLFDDEHEHGRKGSGKGKAKKGSAAAHVEEDQLDTEYRYWSFVEAHPAHNSLPSKAKIEAMDVLTWAWTERLLPSHRAVPAPFTQEECQELTALIRSFGDDRQDDHGIQTRIVSRILLRVAHWRQTYFRPKKPLPADVGPSPSHLPTVPRRPFRRAFFDFVLSCLFLGIPYIFFERARLSSRIDEESGLRNAIPTLVIGACTCLVAAIVLSASVTFISLPGLDPFSRTAGIVAIVFATFSMAATLVAIFRYKADLERPISNVGIEGMMVITRRTVVLSLPLVFLAYSIVAFTIGIVLYSFRGVALTDPSVTRTSFEEYTKWGVVGVVGALAGMVTMSMLLLRR